VNGRWQQPPQELRSAARNDAMRILTVCTSAQIFGAESITLKLLEGFKNSGHEQLALTSIWTDGAFSARLQEIDVAEVRLPFGAFSKRLSPQAAIWTTQFLLRLPQLWFGWRRAVREFRPECLIFTSSRLLLPILPFIGTVPSVLVEHTNLAPTRTRSIMFRMFAKRIDAFVAVSEFMAGHLRDIGAPATKIHLIRNGPISATDRLFLASTHARQGVGEAAGVRIGLAGQITPTKGYDTIVTAAGILREQRLDFQFVVFGRGPADYIEKLKTQIAAAGLTEQFSWNAYQKDKEHIYAAVDVFVVPSTFDDPLPTVAIEAGAHALPVVGTRAGGIPEIVTDAETGWIVDRGDAEQLADRLIWLIQNRDDSRRMGLAAQAKILRVFTQERMVSEFEALFRLLASARKGKS
jgi:glycosyltransferase involved in cell wall biosynthesis